MATKDELRLQISNLKGEITGYMRSREINNQTQSAISDVKNAIDAVERELNPTDADLVAAETKIRGLRASLEILMEQRSVPNSIMDLGAPFFGGAALALVLISALGAVGYMVFAMGAQSWQTIAGGRAVLLLALTLTFVTFGGALLVAPLYAAEKLEERFRRSREVFLLFSGMFSTVVGFYFATAENKFLGASILVAESFDPAKGELQVAVAGGKPHYVIEVEAGEKGEIKKPPQTLEEPGTAMFSFLKSEWPKPITIKVRDSDAGAVKRTVVPNDQDLLNASFDQPKKPSVPTSPASKGTAPSSVP